MGKVVLDWDAGDFTGDARPEAVLATALNQLIAIDGKCVPIWCVDLPFSARHVAVDASRRRIIAADRERIFLFSGTGKRLAEIKADFPCDGVVIRDGQIFFRSGNRILCAGKDI